MVWVLICLRISGLRVRLIVLNKRGTYPRLVGVRGTRRLRSVYPTAVGLRTLLHSNTIFRVKCRHFETIRFCVVRVRCIRIGQCISLTTLIGSSGSASAIRTTSNIRKSQLAIIESGSNTRYNSCLRIRRRPSCGSIRSSSPSRGNNPKPIITTRTVYPIYIP